ncbi:nadB: L-aspartate oxidase [compost metagenome]
MNFDVAIVGSGLAGLTVALQLADTHRVVILSKRAMTQGASDWAQGGIAAVLDSGDSHDEHTQDTLVAGAGLCDEEATRFIVEHGREAIQWLIDRGVPFTRDEQAELGFHLTREGGHSRRRIIHAADATGHAVVSTLLQQATQHPNITILEDHFAIDLITSRKMGLPGNRCYGLYVLDDNTGAVHTLTATHTVLAAGGAGKVYLYTTNPDTATGDGIAMAWRAGCRVSNMEFIQFHPTCLYHPYAKSFLISEAVRGEGGLLKLPDGTRFMPEHDERAELAPRDVVARAIDFEMKKRGLDCVYLLASNSLLECMVIGRAAADDIALKDKAGAPNITLPAWDESRVSDADEEVVVSHNWDELRRMMWNYVGIVRTSKRLERAQHRIGLLREEIAEYYANFRVTRDLLELRNLVEVASLIVDSAYSRHESRGLHFSRDYPDSLPKALPTVMQPPAARKR